MFWESEEMLAKILLTLCALLFAAAAAASQVLFWPVTPERLAQVPGSEITLRNKGAVVATLPTSQVRKLLEIKDRIAGVAGIQNVVLLISNHSEPNAAASRDKNGRPVIYFTIPMLHRLGDDEGMVAAIMGHEFGHLVRNHEGRGDRKAAVTVGGILAGIAV